MTMWFFVFVFFLPFTILYLGLMIAAALYFFMAMKQFMLPGNRSSTRTGQSVRVVMVLSLCAMGAFSWAYFRYIWFW